MVRSSSSCLPLGHSSAAEKTNDMTYVGRLLAKPWIWSFLGAFGVWLAAIVFTRGHGGGGMITAALSLSVFMVIVGIGQMFVITLGPGNVDLSLPANIGLASAIAMKVIDGSDSMVVVGLLAALGSGIAVGATNYLLIWLLRIPPLLLPCRRVSSYSLSTSATAAVCRSSLHRGLPTFPIYVCSVSQSWPCSR